ncbi:unnamed protein product [Lampetra planeri]
MASSFLRLKLRVTDAGCRHPGLCRGDGEPGTVAHRLHAAEPQATATPRERGVVAGPRVDASRRISVAAGGGRDHDDS